MDVANAGTAETGTAVPVTPDPTFLREVEAAGGARISPCFTCVKCSSGCPLGFAMDVLPHRLVRMVQMGMRDEVLRSSAIWLCASCQTCATRCPNGVDIAHLADVLRRMALQAGVKPAEENIARFHAAFMADVRTTGRMHELALVGRYKLLTRQWFRDLGLGWEMFRRGKLKLLPRRVRDRKWLKRLPKFPAP